ncbi:MAG: hypothetical protein HN981_02475 [Candidatus Pacebacteria bacterium]|jgi:hypothetical protein|nr:hypothetical protein [Candidatus Paceibacterota bacterium]MBT6921235.1 hypothetical protein [Candidatus Paceibacterota bacterium]
MINDKNLFKRLGIFLLICSIAAIAFTFNAPYEEICSKEFTPNCIDNCLGSPSESQKINISSSEIESCKTQCCEFKTRKKNMFSEIIIFSLSGVGLYLLFLSIKGDI